MAKRFDQESEDLLSDFYVKWISSKSEGYKENPKRYITRSFRNFYVDYTRNLSPTTPVSNAEFFINELEPSNETKYQSKEVVQVYKLVAKNMLPPKRYKVFENLIDAALDDPDTTRVAVASKMNVSLNKIKHNMVETRKILTKYGYRGKLNKLGYGGSNET